MESRDNRTIIIRRSYTKYLNSFNFLIILLFIYILLFKKKIKLETKIKKLPLIQIGIDEFIDL